MSYYRYITGTFHNILFVQLSNKYLLIYICPVDKVFLFLLNIDLSIKICILNCKTFSQRVLNYL
jgi:hypothetical protein